MRKVYLQILLVGLIMVSFTNCNNVPKKSFDALKAENERLKIENEKLNKELEEERNGPDRLLQMAKTYMENKQFEGAKKFLESLI